MTAHREENLIQLEVQFATENKRGKLIKVVYLFMLVAFTKESPTRWLLLCRVLQHTQLNGVPKIGTL